MCVQNVKEIHLKVSLKTTRQPAVVVLENSWEIIKVIRVHCEETQQLQFFSFSTRVSLLELIYVILICTSVDLLIVTDNLSSLSCLESADTHFSERKQKKQPHINQTVVAVC